MFPSPQKEIGTIITDADKAIVVVKTVRLEKGKSMKRKNICTEIDIMK